MSLVFKLTIVLLFSSLLLNPFFITLAAEQKLLTEQELNSIGFTKYDSINPDSLFFLFKRLSEQAKLLLIFNNDDRIKYFLSLLDTRFNEVVYTINLQKTGFLTETISRYNTQVGKIKQNPTGIDTAYRNKLDQKIKILEILRDRYPANSSYWLSIQQAIDTTKSLL